MAVWLVLRKLAGFLFGSELMRLVTIAVAAFLFGYARAEYRSAQHYKAELAATQAKVDAAQAKENAAASVDAEKEAAFKREIERLRRELEDPNRPAITGRNADRLRALWDH